MLYVSSSQSKLLNFVLGAWKKKTIWTKQNSRVIRSAENSLLGTELMSTEEQAGAMKIHCLHLKPPASTRPCWFSFMANGSWEKGTSWDILTFLVYALVLSLGSLRVTSPFPYQSPRLERTLDFMVLIHPNISECRRADIHSSHVFHDSCNLSNLSSLFFPLLFVFSFQLAICHRSEKQHKQHMEPKACDKAVEKLTQCWDASQICHLQTKATGKKSLRYLHSTSEFALGATDFSQTCIDCSLPYQHQGSSFQASLPSMRFSTITPQKQLTFPFKVFESR